MKVDTPRPVGVRHRARHVRSRGRRTRPRRRGYRSVRHPARGLVRSARWPVSPASDRFRVRRGVVAVVVTSAAIQDRDAVHQPLTAVRARFATISLVWADGDYAGRLVQWAKSVLAPMVQIVERSDTSTVFNAMPPLGRRAKLRMAGQLPPGPRLRDPTRPPRSHGLHRRHPHTHRRLARTDQRT